MNFAAGGVDGELVLGLVLSLQDCGGGEEQEGVAEEISCRGEAGMEAVEHCEGGTPLGMGRGGEPGGGGQVGRVLENCCGHEVPH